MSSLISEEEKEISQLETRWPGAPGDVKVSRETVQCPAHTELTSSLSLELGKKCPQGCLMLTGGVFLVLV